MTNGQKLQLRLSEIRQTLNDLSGLDTPTDAQRTEMDTLATEYRAKETQWRAATIAEADAPEPRAEGGEDTEWRALVERVELRQYLHAAANGVPVAGAEAELNAALELRGAGGVTVPWDALLPRHDDEHRADAATSVGATDHGVTQRSIVGRVFARTAAAFLGVSMPMVPTGDQNFPVLTAGTSAATKNPGVAQDAAAATFTANQLGPTRLTARYLFRVEDLRRLAGMEAALRADLREVMGEAMDATILNGQASAPDINGFIDAGTIAAPTTPTAVVTIASAIEAVASAVDGKYANGLPDIRLVVGAKTYATLATLLSSNSEPVALSVLRRESGGLRVSGHVPDPASNVQQAVVSRTAGGGPNAVAPIWQGLELIRDPYSGAAKGDVSVTAIMLWNFQVIRTDAYARAAFKLAA